MRSSVRLLCAASIVALAVPLTVRAQEPINVQKARMELDAAARELQVASKSSLAGTPRGDALIRDLQALRSEIEMFRAAEESRAPAVDKWRRYNRLVQAYRAVWRDVLGVSDRMDRSLMVKASRLDRAFLALEKIMRFS
jgi:hypothetical protein